jgi:hypothetical protein
MSLHFEDIYGEVRVPAVSVCCNGQEERQQKKFGGPRNGGSAWESNPPNGLLTRYTGFEVRESHQCPIHFQSFL